MAEVSDENVRAALADENTPAPLRDAYEALRTQLESERASRTALERETAFARAGLADLPHRTLFEKSYEGDMTVEAIRSEAAKYNLLPTADAPQQDGRPPTQADIDDALMGDLEAMRRVGAAGTPATAPQGPSFDERISQVRSKEEWDAVVRQYGSDVGIATVKTSKFGHRIV